MQAQAVFMICIDLEGGCLQSECTTPQQIHPQAQRWQKHRGHLNASQFTN